MVENNESLETSSATLHAKEMYDDDGRPARAGTVCTTSSHIITAVIGSGVLSLAWSIAQLGWIFGPIVMLFFSLVTLYTSYFLAYCYRVGDPITGKRSYTYMEAIDNILVLAAVMSLGYSLIGLILGIVKIADNGYVLGDLVGAQGEAPIDKVWGIFQALGNIAFAYSYSNILIEIQDTIKSPYELRTMMFATRISIATTTIFYVLCGTIGYGAFGNAAPGNLLTAFDRPFWLIDIANLALVIHLVGAYQVFSQPLFAFVEQSAAKRWPGIEKEHNIEIPFLPSFRFNTFRLVWRSIFVVVTTFISMLVPFFNDILGVIGALGFWPLTVYFPVEMYIKQMKIQKWSGKWIVLQTLSMFCLLVTIASLIGSVVGVLLDLEKFKPFSSQL
ncbi:hypothetical protein PIB30_015501 [Stylosanthes scabra]|uniref:Amino acid transporter transmembrane domain-containing protein n=1 Tax=Stylosanthes scabra TaxID=79078 RepID=A0ABU6X8S7_9FABA|nr:hypothetical protein [Stylosanthes scabra]